MKKQKTETAPRDGISYSAWAAIVIALCSLILSLHSGCEDRKYKRLSVRPEMGMSFFYTEAKGAGWMDYNTGLGPARIRWFEATVDGVPKKNWKEVAEAVGMSPSATYSFKIPWPNTLYPVSKGEDRIFWVEGQPEAEKVLFKNQNRVALRYCYCSMYDDDCWITDNTPTAPIRSSCDKAPSFAFGAGEYDSLPSRHQ